MKKITVLLSLLIVFSANSFSWSITEESCLWAKYLGISEKYVVEILNEEDLYTEEYCQEIVKKLQYYEQELSSDTFTQNKSILIVIRSFGGSVLGTSLICQTIENLKYPVYTLAHRAGSGATRILAAGTKGHRYVKANTHIMIHLPIHEFSIDISGSTKKIEGDLEKLPEAIKELLADLKKIDEIVIEELAKYTGQPIEKIRQDLYEKGEIWLFREKIVEYGLADKILPIRPN